MFLLLAETMTAAVSKHLVSDIHEQDPENIDGGNVLMQVIDVLKNVAVCQMRRTQRPWTMCRTALGSMLQTPPPCRTSYV